MSKHFSKKNVHTLQDDKVTAIHCQGKYLFCIRALASDTDSLVQATIF